ncbi:hypothetical protein LJC59_09815 [Desulfovibrio sp. OttesenSCG-928-A18]|nr:hypothetical protein [Desulfovibrio sp. OttesenSCG-928-A18]
MSCFSFAKLIPGGNPTILLLEPDLDQEALAGISARLMHPLHLQAEQVGALYWGGVPGAHDGLADAERGGQTKPGHEARAGVAHEIFDPGQPPQVQPPQALPPQVLPMLRMMGGEFCVNATRAAAVLLARRGLMRRCAAASGHKACTTACGVQAGGLSLSPSGPGAAQGPLLAGALRVSGAARPVRVLVAVHEQSLEAGIVRCLARAASPGHIGPAREDGTHNPAPVDLPAAVYSAAELAELDDPAAGVSCRMLEAGTALVRMPGMSHLLLDCAVHPLPDLQSPAWRQCSAKMRRRYGLHMEEASGVVWHGEHPAGRRIWPAVEVRATATEHLESACGSASLALALHLALEGVHEAGDGAARSLTIAQPSGECLRVHLPPPGAADAVPSRAWVSGPVFLAAEGRVFS